MPRSKQSSNNQQVYPSLEHRADYYDLAGAAEQGRILPTSSAAALEEALVFNEFDLVTRARLLGFYETKNRMLRNEQRTKLRLNHILWIIENIPGSKFAGDDYNYIDKKSQPQHYAKALNAWKKQIETRPDCAQIRINAAMFASAASDTKYAIKLAKDVASYEPENRWAQKLLQFLTNSDGEILYELWTLPAKFNRKKFSADSDKAVLSKIDYQGEKMPPISAETLETVVAKFPEDVVARVELISFYRSRWERTNIIKTDPEYLHRLMHHISFCLAFMPGSEYVANARGFASYINRKNAPAEHADLARLWNQLVAENADDGCILANAAGFFHVSRNYQLSKTLSMKAKRIAKGDKNVRCILDRALSKWRGRRIKKLSPKEIQKSLQSIALNIKPPLTATEFFSSDPYTFTDWASEVPLDTAQLAGVYNWVPPSSIDNLERVMPATSVDIYNRAKILGSLLSHFSLRSFRKGSTVSKAVDEKKGVSLIRHVSWLVENLPGSRLTAIMMGYTWDIVKKAGNARRRKLKGQNGTNGHSAENAFLDANAWNQHTFQKKLMDAVAANENDVETLINLTLGMVGVDKTVAVQLVNKFSAKRPDWADRIRLMCGHREAGVMERIKLRDLIPFQSGKREPMLSKVARQARITGIPFKIQFLPGKTFLSNEWTLKKNPNDLALRSELLWGYHSRDQFQVHFGGYTPDVVPQAFEHNLWFISNIPDYYLYAITCNLNLAIDNDFILGPQSTLIDAAVRQIKAYPNNIAIALALVHYFPLGFEDEALDVIADTRTRYPHHPKLAKRVATLISFVDDRSGWRSELTKYS